jgi:hypothetical protein
MTKYRICTDAYAGFEVQKKSLFWLFWTAYFVHGRIVNTFFRLEDAEKFAKKGEVVKYIGVDE